MKKIGILIVAVLSVALIIGGYFFLKEYTQAKAKKTINTMLKEANLQKDVSYKSLQTKPFSKIIKLDGVEWYLEKSGNITGKINIQTVTVKAQSKHNFKVFYKNVVLINLNTETPEELLNKPILTIKDGYLTIIKRDGTTKTEFNANYVLINKSIFELGKANQKTREVLFKVLRIDKPINIQIVTISNEKKNSFSIGKYSLAWKNNFLINYSMSLNNVDIKGFKSIAKNINKKSNNPLVLLNYFSKIYQIKPATFMIEIKNLGLLPRLVDYLAKNQNISKQTLFMQLKTYLDSTPFKTFEKPIINFIENKKKKIKVLIANPSGYSIGDIFQKTRTEPILQVLKVNITN